MPDRGASPGLSLRTPEAEDDPAQPQEGQHRLDRRRPARQDERRREDGEGARDMPGRLAVAPPDDPFEDERGDEAREDGRKTDRPLVRAERLHHQRQDRGEEDRHSARVTERRRGEREEALGEPSLHEVAGTHRPGPLVGSEEIGRAQVQKPEEEARKEGQNEQEAPGRPRVVRHLGHGRHGGGVYGPLFGHLGGSGVIRRPWSEPRRPGVDQRRLPAASTARRTSTW